MLRNILQLSKVLNFNNQDETEDFSGSKLGLYEGLRSTLEGVKENSDTYLASRSFIGVYDYITVLELHEFEKVLAKLETQQLSTKGEEFYKKIGPCFIVRDDYLATTYALGKRTSSANQEVYGSRMALATDVVANVLSQHQTITAREVFTYAIQSRKKTGKLLDHKTWMSIGLKRRFENRERGFFTRTTLERTYYSLNEKIHNRIPGSKENGYLFRAKLPCIDGEFADDGTVIELDQYFSEESLPPFTPEPVLWHTPDTQIDIIEENAIIPYFNKIRATDYEDQKSCWKDLGRLFWWSIRQKYYKYSEPAATEIVVKALAKDRGFPIHQPWKKGLIPWEEVIAEENPEIFAEAFANGDLFGTLAEVDLEVSDFLPHSGGGGGASSSSSAR